MSSLITDKIACKLKKENSLNNNREIKDPRLKNLNINAVKVSDDIGVATVYYSVIGQSILKAESSLDNNILKKFSGMVRSKLAKTMKIRRVPIINFRFDESIEYSENIEKLLQDL